jgi:hypothetical protein
MDDFKLGDKLKVNTSLPLAKVGAILIVVDTPMPAPGCFVSSTEVNINWANEHKETFTLVERQFDFKTDPWYISIESLAQYNAVKEWLQVQHSKTIPVGLAGQQMYLTNIYKDGENVVQTVLWSSTRGGISDKAQEIRLQFMTKTEVVQVTYPIIEVVKKETESQRLLKELQQQIAELQAKAAQLEQEVKN